MSSNVYFEKLLNLKDKFSVKLIVGFRGAGKTALLKKFANHLKSEGIAEEGIIFVDFEKNSITDFRTLYDYVIQKTEGVEKAYILLDEVEKVEGWENAVNAFFMGLPADIYVTGTNEYTLTNEILKLLPDNCDVLKMYPLSFSEFANLKYEMSDEDLLEDILKFGSLPVMAENFPNDNLKKFLLNGIYFETLFKDAIVKYSLRDTDIFHEMMKFLASNLGQPVKAKTVTEHFKTVNKKITSFTMENYLNIADQVGIFKRIRRYDVNKKNFLNGSECFYCIDTGICNSLSNFSRTKKDALIKNLIVLELMRRGYEVRIARVGVAEIDFMAVSGERNIFIQVLPEGNLSAVSKLLRPLNKLSDETEKLLISVEPVKIKGNIKNVTIIDFLSNYFVEN